MAAISRSHAVSYLNLSSFMPTLNLFANSVKKTAAENKDSTFQNTSSLLYDRFKTYALSNKCQIISAPYAQAYWEMLITLSQQCRQKDGDAQVQKRIFDALKKITSQIQSAVYSDIVKLMAEDICTNLRKRDVIFIQERQLSKMFPQISFKKYSKDVMAQVGIMRRQYFQKIDRAVRIPLERLTPDVFCF